MKTKMLRNRHRFALMSDYGELPEYNVDEYADRLTVARPGAGRRRKWSDEDKARIVAEIVASAAAAECAPRPAAFARVLRLSGRSHVLRWRVSTTLRGCISRR